jgi:hypothetical protein
VLLGIRGLSFHFKKLSRSGFVTILDVQKGKIAPGKCIFGKKSGKKHKKVTKNAEKCRKSEKKCKAPLLFALEFLYLAPNMVNAQKKEQRP